MFVFHGVNILQAVAVCKNYFCKVTQPVDSQANLIACFHFQNVARFNRWRQVSDSNGRMAELAPSADLQSAPINRSGNLPLASGPLGRLC
jgi:hypothetical protein